MSQMLKANTKRDYENDGFIGMVYSKEGKVVDKTATYNTQAQAMEAAKSLAHHWNTGGDAD